MAFLIAFGNSKGNTDDQNDSTNHSTCYYTDVHFWFFANSSLNFKPRVTFCATIAIITLQTVAHCFFARQTLNCFIPVVSLGTSCAGCNQSAIVTVVSDAALAIDDKVRSRFLNTNITGVGRVSIAFNTFSQRACCACSSSIAPISS